MSRPGSLRRLVLAGCLVMAAACSSGGRSGGLGLKPTDPSRGYPDWMTEARSARSRGDWEGAETALRYAIGRAPDNPAPYAQLGELRAAAGLPDEAEAAFKAGLAVDGAFRPGRDAYAWFLIGQGRGAEAGALAPQAGRRFEDLHLRGSAQIASGDIVGGVGTLREAKALADRLQGSVPTAALVDVDCRIAGARNPAAVCPRGPVHGKDRE